MYILCYNNLHLVTSSVHGTRHRQSGTLMQIYVVNGDIAQVEADALITAINSGGMWFGGIDAVIMRTAGRQFHDYAASVLRDHPTCKALAARCQQRHSGAFTDVVFTIDDLDDSLYDVVTRALEVADQAGHTTVTMPAIRFGVMARYGGSPESKMLEIATALQDFAERAQSLQTVTVVFYHDDQSVRQLRSAVERRALA